MNNQKYLKELMVKAEMDRAELAYYMGIDAKSTYWAEPPQTAISILKLAAGCLEAERARLVFKNWPGV